MGGDPIAEGVVYPGLSAAARNRQLPYQATPLTAYKELFSVAATNDDDLMENRLNGTLLDFMVDDIKRLESRLGSVEKEKLEIYLEGFEALRERRRKLKGVEAQVRKHAPTVTDKYTSRVETDRIEAHFDIAAAALITGLTNVISIRPDALGTIYTALGADKGVHGLGHGEGADPIGHRRNIRKFHLDQVGRLAAKLEATPEGKGNMLDNTLIVYFSDAGEKHHASLTEWPFILVGGLGGRMKNDRPVSAISQIPSKGPPHHRKPPQHLRPRRRPQARRIRLYGPESVRRISKRPTARTVRVDRGDVCLYEALASYSFDHLLNIDRLLKAISCVLVQSKAKLIMSRDEIDLARTLRCRHTSDKLPLALIWSGRISIIWMCLTAL